MAGENTPLTSVRTRASAKAAVCNRISFVFLLALMGGISFYFNIQVQRLDGELHADEEKIAKLNDIVTSQASVIERFSDSVTNEDVLEKVSSLQADLEKAEKQMKDDLADTQHNIDTQLTSTLQKLDKTVVDAQTEIHDEVEKVKSDVDVYVRTTQDQFSMENSFMVYQLAGTFTLISCLITMWHMTSHLRRFRQPFVQRKILAILWMVPIYCITSWLSLVFVKFEGYLAILRDFYEAYVIYQFLSFLIAVLGRGNRDAVVDLLAQHADHLNPPVRLCGCCFPNPYESARSMADAVLLQCQVFAMQFVLLRPLTSVAMFTLNKIEYFGAGTGAADYRSPQFYIVVVQNITIFVAFSGLLKFYHAVQDDLAWCRPFPKFLCIKGVVFMTFWQGLAISILANTTEIGGSAADADTEAWGKQAQNFLICLEMLGFSIAHFYTFPTDEWEEGYRPVQNTDAKFGDNIALRDFLQDLKLIVSHNKTKKKGKKTASSDSTSTVPDADEEQGVPVEKDELEDGQVEGMDDSSEPNALDEVIEKTNSAACEAEDENTGKSRSSSVSEDSIADIRKSLRASDVPDELKEATSILLESGFLDETIDEGDDDGNESGEKGGARESDGEIGGCSANDERKQDELDVRLVEATEPSDGPGETTNLVGGSDNEGTTPDETTCLLGGTGTSSSDDVLRPSIFTSMGAMNKFT